LLLQSEEIPHRAVRSARLRPKPAGRKLSEALRDKLAIERWLVFGGSWGSTLALAYAQKRPRRVTELILRGIFLGRRSDIAWLYPDPDGAGAVFPDQWEAYLAPIPRAERGQMVRAYDRRLTKSNRHGVQRAARAWAIWEAATSYLRSNETEIEMMGRNRYATALARIECHYFVHRCFLREGQLLDAAAVMRRIPAVYRPGPLRRHLSDARCVGVAPCVARGGAAGDRRRRPCSV
jgi:proline iminopeptidase